MRTYCATINYLSEAIIFPSRSLENIYNRYLKKSSIIYNGLPSPPVIGKNEARENLSKLLGIEKGWKIVSVVGAIQPRKDHLTLLAAGKEVVKKMNNVFFLIVGKGPKEYTNFIKNRIRNLGLDSQVRLVGWWDGDIHRIHAGSDILVISSEQESFGLTAIEALSMQTPVVATRCGGPEEIINDGETGILVPVKDPHAMANAIMFLLNNPEIANNLGVNGRKSVINKFGVNSYVQGIQRIINSIANNC